MDQKLVSNPVYEGLQVPTLEEEPQAKSTILYANKYSGIPEVALEDPELLAVIESTVGLAGNNVLVQLKNKMNTFRNGPWYVDSKNGVIHIHNRKHPESSAYTYIYQYENGEVLNASFRMVEVSSPISGLGGFVSAVSKAIGILQAQIGKQEIGDPGDLPNSDKEVMQLLGLDYQHVEKPFSTWVAPDEVIRHQETLREVNKRLEDDRKESEGQYKTYSAKSKEERVAHNDNQFNSSYDAMKAEDMWKFLNDDPNVGGNPKIAAAFKLYQERCKIFGSDSAEAKAAREEVLKESRDAKLNIDSGDYWTNWSTTLTTDIIRSEISSVYGVQNPKPYDIQTAIEARKNKYISNSHIKKITNVKIGKVDLTYIGPMKAHSVTKGDVYYGQWKATFKMEFFGYGSGKRSMNGERFIRGILDRYDGSVAKRGNGRGGAGGNLSGMISNAASNIGRGKKEKKLQASLRVVGNPILETGQQINIQNVGKKHSGLWYIHKVSHSLEFGQGYITDLQLSRQAPKASAVANYSEIHTQSYTVDNETTDPKSIKRSGRGTTSNKPASKANVVSGNSEYTYQDAANVPFTFDEEMYARSISGDEEALREFTYRVADKNYYNKTHGTNRTVVSSSYNSNDGTYKYTLHPNTMTSQEVPRTTIKSRNYDAIVGTKNKRKK